ncbi:MAG: GIDE domain-containing protein [Halobacteriota archaeon]
MSSITYTKTNSFSTIEQARILLDAPVLSANGDVFSTTQGLLVMGVVFASAGFLILFFRGRKPFERARRYLQAETFDPTEGTSDGPVMLSGAVREYDGTVRSPITEDECVAYETKKQVFQEDWRYDAEKRGKMKRSTGFSDEEAEEKIIRWHTTSSDEEGLPFLVETDGGAVIVDPTGADLDLPLRAMEQPSLLRRTIHRITTLAQFGRVLGTSPTRRLERHIAPDDTVLVVGEIDAPPSTADAIGEISGDSELFVISTRPKWNLVARNLLKTIGASLPGVAFVALGIVFFLAAVVSLE